MRRRIAAVQSRFWKCGPETHPCSGSGMVTRARRTKKGSAIAQQQHLPVSE